MNKKFTRRTLLKSLGLAGVMAGCGLVVTAPRNLSWDEIIEKAKYELLTSAEAALLGSYMARSHDPWRVDDTWKTLQKTSKTSMTNLFAVHPHIEYEMLALVRNCEAYGWPIGPTYCDTFPGA